MKKTRTLVVILLIGIGITKTISPIPVLAEQNIKKPSGQSEGNQLDRSLTGAQRQIMLQMLDKVMGVLRDDQPFIFDKIGLGTVRRIDSWTEDSGKTYSYNADSLPDANILFSTKSDPENDDDDRRTVTAVPESFYFEFFSSHRGLDRQTLEQHLALESYWIDAVGEKHIGNSLMPLPPALRQRVYRYRAKEQATSRFPVDVELFYFEPKDGDENREPRLDAIRITRSYPYLTPEMRKKKREDEQQKKRDQTQ
jgi:hypothetical protein